MKLINEADGTKGGERKVEWIEDCFERSSQCRTIVLKVR